MSENKTFKPETNDTIRVKELRLRDGGRFLRLIFSDLCVYDLSAEYLRVMTPSAEARGHSQHTRKIISGKRHVRIISLHPVGHYAIRPVFDDGHNSGLYRWSFLQELGHNYPQLWDDYLQELATHGLARE